MVREVTYSQWLEFVNEARKGGFKCSALNELKSCYPGNIMTGYDRIMLNELAKLETGLIKKTIDRFQKAVNEGIEEYDLEAIQFGIKEFKKNVANCFFFANIDEYPRLIKEELGTQLVEKFGAFIVEYANFVKRSSENGGSLFFEEFRYICKKAKLKDFIEGYRYNG